MNYRDLSSSWRPRICLQNFDALCVEYPYQLKKLEQKKL